MSERFPINNFNSRIFAFSRCCPSVRRKLYHRITSALLLLLVLGGLLASAPLVEAQHLSSCSNNSYYCYGLADWPGAVLGTSTEIDVVSVTCGSCGGHLSNETWLNDEHDSGCPLYGTCWIEAGYSTYGPNADDNRWSCSPNRAVNCYFWADVRPNPYNAYHEHAVGSIPSGDYGSLALFEIYLNTGVSDYCSGVHVSNADWTVYIAGPTNDHWSQLSTCNKMSANDIATGEELAGSGAASPAALWIDNYWQSTRDGSWHSQTKDVTPQSDNPPKAYWYIKPSQSGTGGELKACTSGC